MRNFIRFAIVAAALCLCGAGAPALALQPAAPAPTAPQAPAPAKPAAPASEELLDINSASVEQLDALPGVGPARAAAIVNGRPFKGKDELHRKKIIPKSVYDKIKDKIIARQK